MVLSLPSSPHFHLSPWAERAPTHTQTMRTQIERSIQAHDIENGDITEFPPGMFEYFTKPSDRTLVTPAMFMETVGRERFDLDQFDIYAMGKRKGDKTPAFWTKLRIVGREFERNVLQGFLSVNIIAGYG